jgi:cell fate regulator YaaT (PSP1 superfamily)
MGTLCAVSFARYGKLYYFSPGELTIRVGDKVLVPTDAGPEVAEVIWAPTWLDEETEGYPRLVGMAGEEDLARDADARRRKAEATVAARRLIREHELPMKVVGVDYVPRDGKVTIYFSAPHRVDFRSLVRDLGATVKCRVELRQLSARDEARVQGGIGPCGRDLCCATFLKDFEAVTIRMAKDQDLPLNPLRISGACGRLMCCLKYEHPLYADFKGATPAVGERVDTPAGAGRVVAHDVPRDQVIVKLAEGGSRCACPRASVCGSRQAYESGPTADTPIGG